jgi:cell division protein FtsX
VRQNVMMRVRIAAVLVVVVGVVGLGSASAVAATDADEVSLEDLPTRKANAEVFMTVAASHAQIRRVERAVARSELVERYAFLDKPAAYQEFKRIFRNDPDLIRKTSAADLPVSFRLQLARLSDRQRAVEEFSRLPGVDKVGVIKTKEEVRRMLAGAVALCAAPTRTFEVFMNVQTTPGEVAAVRAAIEGRPGVVRFEYLDKPAAYQEFKRIFRNDPDLIRKTSAADLPESFRVEVQRDHEGALTRILEQLSGVEKIASPTTEVCATLASPGGGS